MKKMNPCNRTGLVRLALLLLLTAPFMHIQAQQKEIDNALLWKVTGNSLLKPSFLFGTIHLQDKRVFNFNDSLYSFIQNADGFAMEIHPDSIVTGIMERLEKTVRTKAEEKYLKKHLKKDEFDQLNRKLKRELGIDAEHLTMRDAYLLKNYLAKPDARADDMPTFVDAYLFGVARNQGKEIVGLEKVKDQIDLFDDIMSKDMDVSDMLKGIKKEKTLTEKLVQLYLREDLRGIQKMMSLLPDETEDKFLNVRNHLMTSKMDSLMRLKSFVVAVGTAHLPGKQGIIELLREKGYTVEPVFTKSRTHANNYTVKAQQKLTWLTVDEPSLGYSTRMPGKPNPMDMLNGGMKMNMYMDLTSMKVYYTAFVSPTNSITKKNVDSVMKAMTDNAMSSSKGKLIGSKRFTKSEFDVIDFQYKEATEKMYFRAQVFAKDKRVYLVGFGSPREGDLHGKETEEYFNFFTIKDMPAQSWQVHTVTDGYFRVSLPSAPKKVDLPAEDSTIRAVQYSSADNSKGFYYGLTVVTTNPGYVIPDDSAYLSEAIGRLEEAMEMRDLKLQDTVFQGFKAQRVSADLRDNLWLNGLMIVRGNRIYSMLAVTSREDNAPAEVKAFFDSFSFIEYPSIKWKEKRLADQGFNSHLAGEFTRFIFLDDDTALATAARDYSWTTFDSASVTSFSVTRRELSPYLWAKHDTVLLKTYMKDLVEPNEVVTDYKFVRNGGSNGIEFNIIKPTSSLGQRVRVLLNGNAVYMLQTDVPRQYWKQYNYQQFFEGFRFAKEEKPEFLYTNSLERLLTDLRSTDSAKHTQAYNAIGSVMFDSTDMPAVLKAACMEYPLDSLHYTTVSDELLDVVSTTKYGKYTELITSQYLSLQPAQEQFKYELLSLLAQKHTHESYTRLEELLKKGVPTKGSPTILTYRLQDSLLLTKKIYPFLLTLSGDTLLGTALCDVHIEMLDSNIVKLDDIKAYQPLILKAARNELRKIASDTSKYFLSPGMYSMMQVLFRLNTDSSINMLKRFTTARHNNVKYLSTIALLKAKRSVDPAVLLTLAADTDWRVDLHDQMKELKQEKLYPVKYLNQKAFSEGHLYNYFEDEEPSKVEFVGERIATFKGKKQKFFLYKITMESEEGQDSYLFITGAFNPDGKSVDLETHVSGIYYDEKFKQPLVDKHFKAYLKAYEEEVEVIM